jgi:hypothetical protein
MMLPGEDKLAIGNRAARFFLDQPKLHAAFLLASNYLAGVTLSPKEKGIKDHFVCPLDKGIVEPSFYQNNIKKSAELETSLRQGIEKMRLSDRRIIFVLPEISQKTFVFLFDTLPGHRKERDQMVRFRIKKQIPLLPDDARISYSLVARASVIKEYEDFFQRLKLKVRSVGIPFAGLVNLMQKEKENLMLVNVEEDAFSLVALIHSGISLYRQKSFAFETQEEDPVMPRYDDILLEVENTLNFIEDKEKKKITSLWVRTVLPKTEEKLLKDLAQRLSVQVVGLDACLEGSLNPGEKRLLSPLLGYVQ